MICLKLSNILEELIVSKLPPDKVVLQKTNILSHHHENVRACGGSIQHVAGNTANHHATVSIYLRLSHHSSGIVTVDFSNLIIFYSKL